MWLRRFLVPQAERGDQPVRAFDVALCTFAVLALELGLIRWIGSQVRIVAYFANLILLAAFLGMGLGIALGRKRPLLVHAALPVLAALSVVLTWARELGLMNIRFPDPAIFLWGGQTDEANLVYFLAVTAFVVALFWAVAIVFAFVSAPLGRLFDRIEPLRAYTADIAGSLAGIVAVTLVSAAGAKPWEWMALGVLPVLRFSRTPASIVAAAAIIGFAAISGRSAFFSPYNRIDLVATAEPAPGADPLRRGWDLAVNRDYHQHIADFSERSVAAERKDTTSLIPLYQAAYDLPFRLRPGGKRALIVGAGAGNDASAGLRAGFEVTAVEIDPVIVRLGTLLHPEDPYGNSRVRAVVDDARAFFQRNPPGTYDVVSYGLVDSHAMFSAMSSLRLDNYVYTVEGIRAGWAQTSPEGLLSISFSTFAGPWIEERLLKTVRDATGMTPVLVRHQLDFGATFIAAKSVDTLLIPRELRGRTVVNPPVLESVRVPTDNWPFLYLRPDTVPYGYIVVMLLVAITATLVVRRVFAGDSGERSSLDPTMFFMGAGFMLLETRMVTELGLLLGSTWIVNSAVFAGILTMVLAANLWVSRRPPTNITRWFLPLLAGIVVTWFAGAGLLNTLPIVTRGVVGGLLFALPIGFAGVIVATLLTRSKSPAAALGSNLTGALLGGVLEYSSMFAGLRFVGALALLCYAAAFAYQRAAQRELPA